MHDISGFEPIQSLYEAACSVLRDGQPAGALSGAVERIEALCRIRAMPDGARVVALAKDLYHDSTCDIEVDDRPIVCDSGGSGWWVMAWVFVPRDGVTDLRPSGDSHMPS